MIPCDQSVSPIGTPRDVVVSLIRAAIQFGEGWWRDGDAKITAAIVINFPVVIRRPLVTWT